MSGLEIAGLVLGAFPLIVTALEKYRDAFEPLHEWWSFESDFVNFIEEMMWQQDQFDINLKLLLSPLELPEAQMNALLSQESPEAWNEEDLQKALGERLGRSYESYFAICRKMNKTLRHLENLVGIRNGSVRHTNASRWDLEMRRLRVSFSRKKFKHVQQLEKYNNRLQVCLASNDALAPIRRAKPRVDFVNSLQAIRQHSQVFYSVLKSRWNCDCGMPHESKIRLDVVDHDQLSYNPTLHVLFVTQGVSKSVKVCTGDLRTTDEHKEIRKPTTMLPSDALLELRNQARQRPTVAKISSRSKTGHTVGKGMLQSTITITPVQPLAAKNTMRSKKSEPQRIPRTAAISINTTQAVAASKTQAGKPSQHQDMCEIQDIFCSGVRDWIVDAGGFGYIAPREATERPIYLYSDSQCTHLERQSHSITLESILSGCQRKGADARNLRMRERLAYARTLAYAMPQFQHTSWLSSIWGKRDISFISSTPDLPPTTTKLYISKSFPSDTPVQNVTQEDCERSLQYLGIIMLELIFKKSLESLPLRNRFLGRDGQPTEFTDHNTARSWQLQVVGKCGDDLSEVVRRCLNCSFGPQPDWNSKDFLEAYRTHVLQPFEEILEPWSKPSLGNSIREMAQSN